MDQNHQGENKEKFNGEELEFEPYMFDQGRLGDVAMPAPGADTELITIMGQADVQPGETGSGLASVEPFAMEGNSEGNADYGQQISAYDGTIESDLPAIETDWARPIEFVGQDVPMPDYLKAAEPASKYPSGPLTQNGLHTQTSPRLPSTPLYNTGPMPADTLAGSAPSGTAWSDSSLASIEDFSSVLVALRVGKQMTVSGPLSVPEGSAPVQPSSDVAVAEPAGPETAEADSQPVPDWAAQAVAEMSSAGDTEQTPAAWLAPYTELPPAEATRSEEPPVGEALAQVEPVASMPQEQPEASAEEEVYPQTEAPYAQAETETPMAQMVEETATFEEAVAVPPEPASTTAQQQPEATPAPAQPVMEQVLTPEAGHEQPVPQIQAEASPQQLEEPPQAEAIHDVSDGDNSIEFESFMFDQGAAMPLPVLPTGIEPPIPGQTQTPTPNIEQAPYEAHVAPAASMSAEQQPHSVDQSAPTMYEQSYVEDTALNDRGSLPFWLQEATKAVSSGPAGTSVTPGDWASMPVSSPEDEIAAVHQEATARQEEPPDLGELPPIDPFDFSMLNLQPEEERLGIDLEELSGTAKPTNQPMRVTANLEAVADLLGIPSAETFIAKVKATGRQTGHLKQTGQLENAQPTEAAQPEPITEQQPAESEQSPDAQNHSPGWTASPTTVLPHRKGKQTAVLPNEDAASTEHFTEADLDVAPFDYTKLDLEDEEANTEQLDTQITGVITGVFPSTINLEPKASKTSPWLKLDNEDQTWGDHDNDTSLFAASQGESEPAEETEAPTGWLQEESVAPQETAPQAQAQASEGASIFKARVAQSSHQAKSSNGSAARQTAHHEPDKEAPKPGAAPARSKREQAHRSASDVNTSGPLPMIDGFEELREIVSRNPGDIGAHLALARAYTQVNDLDGALRVYRRILKKRVVSSSILDMIEDELGEVEAEAGGTPRFHQIRGDLLMKQGRFQDAIAEYNKIR